MEEIWKDVVGYEGLYLVSNMGRVKSMHSRNTHRAHRSDGILSPLNTGTGYHKVLLSNGTVKQAKVHRIVAAAFIDNPENKPQINHKNGIRTDNRVENLEWATNSENSKHSYAVLNHSKAGAEAMRLKNSIPVSQYTADGNIVATYGSASDAARANGFNAMHISGCCRGERKTHMGFIWKREAA